MGYDIEGVGRSVEHLAHKVSSLTDAVTDNVKEDKESNMGDIAGLLALMQGNKGMDLPGLLALCKEKGYDRGWGGEGMFLFVFLILFLFAGGGWSNLGRNNQEAFASMAGNNCQSIIGLHDRIADARSVSQLGFQSLQTWLCESIANVTNSVRNQGDRAVDATRNVGDTDATAAARWKPLWLLSTARSMVLAVTSVSRVASSMPRLSLKPLRLKMPVQLWSAVSLSSRRIAAAK